ncbi:MAG: 2-dehydropantoate 2-reductase N-terminal domain-containing protein [Pseudomonadota bacterium]
MRYVIIGAGGVGGTVGARLLMAEREVVFVARGAHGDALRDRGLTFITPSGEHQLPTAAVSTPVELDLRADDCVLLCVKTQQSIAALAALRSACDAQGVEPALVCAQNGVSNEDFALRRFARVYAMLVQLPGTHLQPGEVITQAEAAGGVLDTGCYPQGVDSTCETLCADLRAAGFSATADPRVMRKKYGKLLTNLGNAPQALLPAAEQVSDAARALLRRATKEALACFAAAGIDCATRDEMHAQLAQIGYHDAVAGQSRQGGSSWQSLARGTGDIEADYLNGEVVRLGRLHGVATPVNLAFQRLAVMAARAGAAPGSVSLAELGERIDRLTDPA